MTTLDFHSNNDKKPRYQLIADHLRQQIQSGALSNGARLATERELAASLGVARGTVKQAYTVLQQENLLKKTQGRGTFVCCERAFRGQTLRQETLDAIDRLRTLGLSLPQIRLLAEQAYTTAERCRNTHLVFIDCNEEIVTAALRQIHSTCPCTVIPCLLSELPARAEELEQSGALLVTTDSHYAEVCAHLPPRTHIERVSLGLSRYFIAALAGLPAGTRLGVLYRSPLYLAIVAEYLARLAPDRTYTALSPDVSDAEAAACDTLIVPPIGFCRTDNALRARITALQTAGKNVLYFEYLLDRGSLLLLSDLLDRQRAAAKSV